MHVLCDMTRFYSMQDIDYKDPVPVSSNRAFIRVSDHQSLAPINITLRSESLGVTIAI